MRDHLVAEGRPYGIKFRMPSRLSNSHLALLASEYARDQGQFQAFHNAVFGRYFTAQDNIGDISVLKSIAQEVGLDGEAMERAIREGVYDERLQEASALGQSFGVDGTPTFVLDRRYKIVGAQPYDVFKSAFTEILSSAT